MTIYDYSNQVNRKVDDLIKELMSEEAINALIEEHILASKRYINRAKVQLEESHLSLQIAETTTQECRRLIEIRDAKFNLKV